MWPAAGIEWAQAPDGSEGGCTGGLPPHGIPMGIHSRTGTYKKFF